MGVGPAENRLLPASTIYIVDLTLSFVTDSSTTTARRFMFNEPFWLAYLNHRQSKHDRYQEIE